MGQNNPNQNRPQDQRGRNHMLAEGKFGAPLDGVGLRVVLEGKNLLVQLYDTQTGQASTALTISLPKPVAGLWRSVLDGNGGNGQ